MCGIVAYIGHREAYPIIIKGLKRLEYRGYDSAGVALLTPEKALNIYKACCENGKKLRTIFTRQQIETLQELLQDY